MSIKIADKNLFVSAPKVDAEPFLNFHVRQPRLAENLKGLSLSTFAGIEHRAVAAPARASLAERLPELKVEPYVAQLTTNKQTPGLFSPVANKGNFLFDSLAHAGHADAGEPPLRIFNTPPNVEGRLQQLRIDLKNVLPEHYDIVRYAAEMEQALDKGTLSHGAAVDKILHDFEQTSISNEGLHIPEPSFDQPLKDTKHQDISVTEPGSWRNKNITLASNLDEVTRQRFTQALDNLARTQSGAALLRHVEALPLTIKVSKDTNGGGAAYHHPVVVEKSGNVGPNSVDLSYKWEATIQIPSEIPQPINREGNYFDTSLEQIIGHESFHAATGFRAMALEMEVRQKQVRGEISSEKAKALIKALHAHDEDVAVHWQHVYSKETGETPRYWSFYDRHLSLPLQLADLKKNNQGKFFVAFDGHQLRAVRGDELPLYSQRSQEGSRLATLEQFKNKVLNSSPYPQEMPVAYEIKNELSAVDFERIENRTLKFGISEAPVVLRLVPGTSSPELILTLPGNTKLHIPPKAFNALIENQFEKIPLIVEKPDGKKVETSSAERKKAENNGGVIDFFPLVYGWKKK